MVRVGAGGLETRPKSADVVTDCRTTRKRKRIIQYPGVLCVNGVKWGMKETLVAPF
jgi:hypothetical protein